MRFSVECAFPHLGKRRAASRKSALCHLRLTEKRTLPPAPHGKMHSATYISRKGALRDPQIAQTAPLRDVVAPGGVWGNPPPGCGALWRMAQLGKRARATPRRAAGRLARGPADLGSESGLTERRTLPDRRASECAFPSRRDRRLRFSVECAFPHLGKRRAASRKSALWPDRLTEKRTLRVLAHA